MANSYFSFKQFTIYQDKASFKVGTDGVLLGACTNTTGVKKILDIGTGTGLIAIMLAQKSNAQIIAIEPDDGSYIQACDNVALCKWNHRIDVEHTDFQSYNPGKEKFDLIISNPPFFINSLKSPDPRKSSARHNNSLTSDEILKGVSKLLHETGRLQLILPYVEGNVFIAEAQEYGFYCNSIIKIRPLPNHDVKRLVLTFSTTQSVLSERFLTIEHGKRHEFTEEYVNLTKDFYLKF